MTDQTRADRILTALKNNPIVAPIIALGICIAAVGAFWNNLPQPWRATASEVFHIGKVDNGWLFVGYLDAQTPVAWSEGPYAQVVGSETDPLRHFKIGNVIRLTHDRELIIANYRVAGARDAYKPPPEIHSVLQRSDHTSSVVKSGTELVVRDVWIGGYPGHDYAVWLRVVPATSSD